MDAQVVVVLLILVFLAFVGFCVYFIFKILEFVIRAINLYEKMVNRQDMTNKLLKELSTAFPKEAHKKPSRRPEKVISSQNKKELKADEDNKRPITTCSTCNEKFEMLVDTSHVNPVCPSCLEA